MEAAPPAEAPVVEKVNLVPIPPPADYHCECRLCSTFMGVLKRPDGSYYSKLERNQYYSAAERGPDGHIAKTPLHIARWAVQEYTSPGDWVFDPTIGAGTTAVEAVRQGRHAAGIEIEFFDTLLANVRENCPPGIKFALWHDDARNVREKLAELLGDIEEAHMRPIRLVVNNPPYSGDVRETGKKTEAGKARIATYDPRYNNLGLMKESDEYWRTIQDIYQGCVEALAPGGHFVVGVKDMIKNKTPFNLHLRYGELLEAVGLTHVGTVVLPHYPPTLFMSTYSKKNPDVRMPRYQTIIVFRKP